jgi:hypothetical protein
MSIVENLTRRVGRALVPRPAAPDRGPRIAGQIEAIEKELGALNAERPPLALGAVAGDAAAEERLGEIDGQISGLERRLSTLNAAMDAAKAADHESFEQEQARRRAVAVGEVRKRLAERDAAAEVLTKALGEAVAAYRAMQAAAKAARAAIPADTVVEGLADGPALAMATEREIHRLTGGDLGPTAFPCRHQAYLGNLNDLASLPDVLRAATENIVDQLEHPAPQPERARTRRYFSGGRT